MSCYTEVGFFRLTSLVTQTVKSSPAMWETWVRSLGWEDPLEEEMATYSSILTWKIPWTEGLSRLQSTGLQRVRHDLGTEHTRTQPFLACSESPWKILSVDRRASLELAKEGHPVHFTGRETEVREKRLPWGNTMSPLCARLLWNEGVLSRLSHLLFLWT